MAVKHGTAWKEKLGRELGEIRRRLEMYLVCVGISASALKHQNAEQDADVAMALQRGVASPLSYDIERIDGLRKQLERPVRAKRPGRKEGKKKGQR